MAPRPTQSGASGDLGHPAQRAPSGSGPAEAPQQKQHKEKKKKKRRHDDASRAAQPSEGHAFHASGAHTAAGEQFPRVNGSSVSMAL